MNAALRILYAEDNALDVDLTRAHFSEHAPDIEIEVVETGQACLDRLTRVGCDLLLLDHHLPDMEGLDVLKRLVHAEMRVPVVLVTGVGDEDLVVKALRLGAANYVPKSGNYLASLPDLLRLVIQEHGFKESQGLLPSVSRRVLYVEHHTMDIELTLRHFAEVAPQFEIDVVHTCADALARLAQPPAYDVALIDLRMPDQSGLDFAREARRRRLPLPPFIMISGMGDEAAAIASLKLGAADYVAKREGYLDQLQYTIDHAIAHDRLDRLSEQLQAELAARKRAEDELRFRNLILSTQQEASIDGILVVDTNGKIISSNRRFAEMWGIPSDILQSGSDERALQWVTDKLADPEGFFRKVKHLYGASDEKSQDEIALKDGRTFDRYSAPMLGADGKYLGRVWYFRDITERRRNEAALAAAHSDLERRVAERTAELMVSNQELESFASSVSHDLRAPLRGIDGWSQAVLEDCGSQLDDRGRKYLKLVRSETHRMGQLIDDLLELSRVTRAPMRRETVDLTAMAQELEAGLRSSEPDRVVDFAIAPRIVATGDAVLLRAALQNLLHNAWKFTGKRPRARIEVGCSFEGGQTAYYVCDDGVGFDMSYAGKLFAPFERLHGLAEFPGTGIGLATVQRIIHRHGGKVWATAAIDQGATFYFTLTA